MNRNPDRQTRTPKYGPDSEQDPYTQTPSSYEESASSDPPRRRRSQAARLRSQDNIDDPYQEEPLDTPPRYSRTAPTQADSPSYERPRQGRRERAAQYDPPDDYNVDDPYDEPDPYEQQRPHPRTDSRDRVSPYARTDKPARAPAVRSDRARTTRGQEPVDRDPYMRPNPYERERARDLYDEDIDDREPPYEDDYDAGYEEEPPPKRRWLVWVIIAVIVLALVGGVTFIGLRNPGIVEPVVQWARELISGPTPTAEPTPEPTPEPVITPAPPPEASAARVVTMTANPEVQPDLDSAIDFEIRTTSETDRLQMVNENGVLLSEANGDLAYEDTGDGRLWRMRIFFTEPYEGAIEVFPGNESGWNDTGGSRITVKVGNPDGTSPDTGDTVQQGVTPDTGDTLTSSGTVATPVQLTTQAYDKQGEVSTFQQQTPLNFASAEAYKGEKGMRGVTTFRGSNMRQNAAYGLISANASTLRHVWTAKAGDPSSGDYAFGAQPIIVQWHANIREMMSLNENKLNVEELKEVIYAGNDGYLYFYDLEDGFPTRTPFAGEDIVPMLGTPSVYPFGYPLLAVGSGNPTATEMDDTTGMVIFDLLTNRDIGKFPGLSSDAYANDATFITSPLFDNGSDTLVFAGGNGLLFTMQLETTLNAAEKYITVAPSTEGYRSRANNEDTRVDSSLATYNGYAYYATGGGILQCVNINTLQPVWALNVAADTDASIALMERSDGSVVLFHASKADMEGFAHLRCIDAMAGTVLWDKAVPGGSITASPLVGMNLLDNMVFFAASSAEVGGTLYALNATTGDTVWQYGLTGSMLSSPLALYDVNGSGWIVQGDESGLLLLSATTGEVLHSLTLDGAIYGSPAAFNNRVVVATVTGQMHCIAVE